MNSKLPLFQDLKVSRMLFFFFNSRVSVCVAGKSPSQQFTALIHMVSPLQSQISPVVKLIIAVAKSKFCAQVGAALASPLRSRVTFWQNSSSKYLFHFLRINLYSLANPCRVLEHVSLCTGGLNNHLNECDVNKDIEDEVYKP